MKTEKEQILAKINALLPFGGFLALIALGVILYSCGDDSSITDCSKRGLPQHYDGKKWTCKK